MNGDVFSHGRNRRTNGWNEAFNRHANGCRAKGRKRNDDTRATPHIFSIGDKKETKSWRWSTSIECKRTSQVQTVWQEILMEEMTQYEEEQALEAYAMKWRRRRRQNHFNHRR